MTIMTLQITLSQINDADSEQFVDLLSDIFEHSTWIPERAWKDSPFNSVQELLGSMVAVVDAATKEEQLALLRAHPQLAGKEADAGELTKHSTDEQQQVGMNTLSYDETLRVKKLNHDYFEKFGWPFIIAVLENTKDDIFTEWQQRLNNNQDIELNKCLEQVYLIAKLRLSALFGPSEN